MQVLGHHSWVSKGEQCTYVHSWDNMEKQNRCFICSGENHFAKDCPTKKPRDAKRVAKIKGSQGSRRPG